MLDSSATYHLPNSVAYTDWQERAAIAQRSILGRHLVTSFFLPGTATALTIWPYSVKDRFAGPWHFWWQAHFIDCVIDAAERDPSLCATTVVRRLIRTHYYVNGRYWRHNPYYDDLAWIGLAVQRACARGLVWGYQRRLVRLAHYLWEAYDPDFAIPWRIGEKFWNTPANAPIAIFLARQGDSDSVHKARILADWMYDNLRLTEGPYAGLYADGLRLVNGEERRVDQIFTYCQGVVLGAELELALRSGGNKQLIHLDRVCSLVEACACSLAMDDGVLTAGGGGDGGLFKGIFMRYLAEVAEKLPDPLICHEALPSERIATVKRTAKEMVLRNAEAAWQTAIWLEDYEGEKGGILFSHKWSRKARLPLSVTELKDSGERAKKVGGAVRSSEISEQDLSTQLSGWMTIEAAARLKRLVV